VTVTRRHRWIAFILAMVVIAACSGPTHRGAVAPTPGTLSAQELLYGRGPTGTATATLQPDVVVVGGGAGSVVSATADGTTWTLKPSAAHVGSLAVGKVMVLTDHATGRILTLSHRARGVVVTLLPVPLGEIFKNATISFHVPISATDLAFQPAPGPGGDVDVPPPSAVPLGGGSLTSVTTATGTSAAPGLTTTPDALLTAAVTDLQAASPCSTTTLPSQTTTTTTPCGPSCPALSEWR